VGFAAGTTLSGNFVGNPQIVRHEELCFGVRPRRLDTCSFEKVAQA